MCVCSVVGLLDLVKEVAEEAVRRWEGLTQDQQMEIATELIPDIEQVGLWKLSDLVSVCCAPGMGYVPQLWQYTEPESQRRVAR